MVVITAHGAEGELADATCPKSAPQAIGGGGSVENKGGVLEISAPLTDRELTQEGQTPTGWRVRSEAGRYTSYAICTQVGRHELPEEEPEKERAEEEAATEK